MKRPRSIVVLCGSIALVLSAGLFAADAPPASQSSSATTKPGTTITQPDGLKITYTSPGSPEARDGDTVSVLYTGKLQDGTVFDASEKHGNEPIEFILGKGMVIKGWDQGLLGMVVGEKRTLTIPPALGYGEQGAGTVIPPNATLTFDVELVGLRRPAENK